MIALTIRRIDVEHAVGDGHIFIYKSSARHRKSGAVGAAGGRCYSAGARLRATARHNAESAAEVTGLVVCARR